MELWDAYDSKCNKTGDVLVRGEEIPTGKFHAVVEVMVVHKDGTYLLMQRDFDKPNNPGQYETGAGGSVIKGESFIDGATRELWEETGITADKLKNIYCEISEKRRSIYIGYLCIWDGDKDSIVLQQGETIAYKWLTKNELINFMKTDDFVQTLRNRIKTFIL